MSRRYGTFSHPGVLMPLLVFAILGLFCVIITLGYVLTL